MNFILLSIVFGIVQIGIFNVFPKFIRNILFAIPLFAILMNAFGSYMIVMIAGRSAFIGSCNLAGSLLFAGYILLLNQPKEFE